MFLLLVIVLILLAIGMLPHWPYSMTWGYYPSSGAAILLVVVIIMIVMGRAPV